MLVPKKYYPCIVKTMLTKLSSVFTKETGNEKLEGSYEAQYTDSKTNNSTCI